jgi:hypothetical protein
MYASTYDFLLRPLVMHVLNVLDGFSGVVGVVVQAEKVRHVV